MCTAACIIAADLLTMTTAWISVSVKFGEGGDNGLEVGVHPIVDRDLARPKGSARHHPMPGSMSRNITFPVVGSTSDRAIDAKRLLSRRIIIEARFMLEN
jgi:hypothetical protein